MKVWFITGCSKGFGKALVEELLKNKDNYVVATARNPESLKEIQTNYNERVLVLKLDVKNQVEIEQAVKEATRKFNRIDVLVNNAGYGFGGALEECSMEDIRDIFETNVFGLMAMTKAVLPIMRQQKSGHIINISSIAGLVAMAGSGIYNSTKFAVEGLSESLSMDVSNFGIKVTIIEPGPFRTDFAGGSIKLAIPMEEYRESQAAKIREYLSSMNNNQPGDPIKAVKIIIMVTEMENPPLRLPLGNIAIERISAKNKKQQEEFLQYEKLSRSADYDA